MKFDRCLMNPPYGNGGLDVKYLDKSLEISNAVCTVQPSIFLFGKNKESRSLLYMNNVKNIINEYGGIIENVDGCKYFDAAPPQDLAIITVNKNQKDNIKLIGYSSTVSEFNNISDIRKYGYNENLLALENKLKSLFEKDNFWNHIVCGPRAEGHLGKKENNNKIDWNPNPNSIIVSLTSVRGNRLGNDDFYTAIPANLKPVLYKNYKSNKGADSPWYYIVCPSFEYANNLIDYLKSDFVRMCLYFTKVSTELDLKIIPWEDFNKKCTDKELYKRYKISNDEEKLIQQILPDYYGIRK